MNPPFVRDRATWTVYLMLGYYGFVLNALGPLLPLLRRDLGLTYAQASLHTSAFAVGLLVASVTADGLGRRFGAGAVLWGGVAGMGAGGVLLAAAPSFPVSLLGALVMGTLGSLALVQISAVLARRHGEGRGRAFAEANAVSSVCGVLAPLALGGAVAAGLGWPVVLWVAAAVPGLLALGFARVRFGRPAHPSTGPESDPGRALPSRYWRYWGVMVLGVAVEFGVGFWAADFLTTAGGLDRATAVTAVSAFLLAMLLGRASGGFLLSRFPAGRVVAVSLAVALVGFLAYWQFGSLPARLLGLFVTGLGVANLYPALLALAVSTAPGREDVASARAALASGLAMLLAPFALGALADASSLLLAQSVIPTLLVLAGAALWWAERGSEAATLARPSS
ncbi:MFS transporter [Deinococcus sp. YIM 134068]|uniref:MFS transporter n=1 Tax=Deinococcus lichenicola TaxID=3118910 RepID=UPI002F9454F8